MEIFLKKKTIFGESHPHVILIPIGKKLLISKIYFLKWPHSNSNGHDLKCTLSCFGQKTYVLVW